ncbi:NAD(P)/FAD-dependent oxidoreductase [Propylenella binzhouense]|uniref:NADH:ubiquinone reductase (non-electrogenic) n=1 Tax=Propylenella binzhouense TaxID=2555902 RepID=A0A964WUH4_9HYPH|nr:NAD(P)/FAD-dependent oxidoreductase [Propylenella binzhouense]MYZ49071.1 NAD(P)/FAD-dependent oxidoreductase [Propylenella binzhouense]
MTPGGQAASENKGGAPAAAPPRVVIVGAGFGGLACARALGNARARVTIIDRRNYHLFVPLLYQVATAALSPADIAQPVRRILSRYPNIEVLMDEVTGVDWPARTVRLSSGAEIAYDRLVLATGSRYAYFGHDEWSARAPGLKGIEDARRIRARLLQGFELAEACRDPERQRTLTTTVIVGGGPTGVEMAGAVAELCRFALARDFRHVEPRSARVILLEAGPRILPQFPERLSAYAAERLRRLGVTVRTGSPVEAIEEGIVVAAGERIAAGTIVWGAGVQATSASGWVPAERDRSGRIVVAPDLGVPSVEGVYAIGDLAHAKSADGTPLPGLAQVASQQGTHLGRSLSREFEDGVPVPPFRFRDRGNTAIIGRNAAVFDFGRRQLTGLTAWILWAVVHVYLLSGFEKRLSVTLQWLWRYATYERGARLIDPNPNAAEARNAGPSS